MSLDAPLEIQRREKACKYLRMFLMDNEEMNRLLRRKEIDNDRLQFAIDLCISDFNSTTPISKHYSLSNFPSLYLLIIGSAVQCLRMAGLYQTRNQLQYSAGGSSFVRNDKGPAYLGWAQNFAAEYESKKLNLKIQSNVESAYGGGFMSEYSLIGFDW